MNCGSSRRYRVPHLTSFLGKLIRKVKKVVRKALKTLNRSRFLDPLVWT